MKIACIALLVHFLILGCNNMMSEQNRDENQKDHLLSIALQEGFQNATVVIHCNDMKVYESKKVTSDIRYGLADSFEIPIAEGLNQITVTVVDQGLSRKFQVESTKAPYVGISLLKGDLDVKFSEQPFGYL